MKKLKRIWYKLGIRLFGDFFKRLYQAQAARKRQVALQKATAYKMQKQGVHIFTIDGITVAARNRKNAEKKVQSIKNKNRSNEKTKPTI